MHSWDFSVHGCIICQIVSVGFIFRLSKYRACKACWIDSPVAKRLIDAALCLNADLEATYSEDEDRSDEGGKCYQMFLIRNSLTKAFD